MKLPAFGDNEAAVLETLSQLTKITIMISLIALSLSGYWRCTETYKAPTFHWQIGCGLALWWLSQLWVSKHIWFSTSERLAKVER